MYKAILFAPDGDYVTDFTNTDTKQEVWDKINDMGSRWVFYPICFVAKKIIVDTPEGLEHLKGKTIKQISEHLKNTDQDELCKYINNGWPLQTIL